MGYFNRNAPSLVICAPGSSRRISPHPGSILSVAYPSSFVFFHFETDVPAREYPKSDEVSAEDPFVKKESEKVKIEEEEECEGLLMSESEDEGSATHSGEWLAPAFAR
jgi:hypothetical protein